VKFFAPLLVLAACLLGLPAQSAPVKVALLTGDARNCAVMSR
jgi:hypothetical protein